MIRIVRKSTIDDYEWMVNHLRQERDELRRREMTPHRLLDQATKTVADLKAQVEALKVECVRYSAEIERLAACNKATTADHVEAMVRAQRADARAARLEHTELAEARHEIDQLREALNRIQSDRAGSALEDEVGRLESGLRQAIDARDHYVGILRAVAKYLPADLYPTVSHEDFE